MNSIDRTRSDKLGEECGVFGIYDFGPTMRAAAARKAAGVSLPVAPGAGPAAGETEVAATPAASFDAKAPKILPSVEPATAVCAHTIYYGLLALQHRGQESCGIAVSDTHGPKGKVLSYKQMGLVNESFTPAVLDSLTGDIGVGHVRYSTTGSSTRENAQPLVLNYIKGTLAIAHNGNLVNASELRQQLAYTGAIFQTTIDSEVIAFEIARNRLKARNIEEAVSLTMSMLKGAYSLVIMSPRKLIGCRDPFGFRPLCIGVRQNPDGTKEWILSSESCALDTVGATFVRDVEPGEIVTISPDIEGGIASDRTHCIPPMQQGHCIFEYIYFARPDSIIDRQSVYNARILAGKFLAVDSPVDADVVVGVPESGNIAALGYSMQSGIPYGHAFVKNSYVGRTFIKPTQKSRESGVQVKLNPIRDAVSGKRVIMVDDSIVRGTTSDLIVQMLYKAGAREVHVRISSPPFLYPCYFGTDIPASEQLIAYNRTVEDIRKIIGADSLAYLRQDRLEQMVSGIPERPDEIGVLDKTSAAASSDAEIKALHGKNNTSTNRSVPDREKGCAAFGICKGCFTGHWPVDPPQDEDFRGESEQWEGLLTGGTNKGLPDLRLD